MRCKSYFLSQFYGVELDLKFIYNIVYFIVHFPKQAWPEAEGYAMKEQEN